MVIDFLLSGFSMGGVLTRDASVTIVEKVAEIGDESNSPSVTMSTNFSFDSNSCSVVGHSISGGWGFRKAVVCFDRKGVFLIRDW